jgi:hypothetical protein
MLLTQRDRTAPLVLVQRKQALFALVAGALGLCMHVAAVAEVPRLAVNIRVGSRKEFTHAVPQPERGVIAFAWLPVLGLSGLVVSASPHGCTTPHSIHSFILE